jgi:catechol 2,3-dioxygenase-like lactoylglutathione lyase family enzyme
MSQAPRLRFLSIFVPDLAAATQRYEAVFGVPPVKDDGDPPSPHPYAAGGPVVFDLGGVKLALYQCDGKTTHPGDVGIGIRPDGPPGEIAKRATEHRGQVFYGPRELPGDGRPMAVFMLPDRHFFEVLGGADGDG